MTDEIEYNPFFKALQEDFSVVYEKAQSECCTICIPQTTSLPKSKVSLDFVEMHILSPSPYFRGQYVNWNKSRAEFEIDEDLITAIKGFQKPFSVRILSEELAYNKKYEPFKILILDHPLDPSLTSSLVSDTTESVSQPGKSSLEYCQFLQSKRHAQKALAQLDKEIVAFNKNYVIVEGYLDQTASRLETICKQSLQVIAIRAHMIMMQITNTSSSCCFVMVEHKK
ncbi:putative uncharacterized protein DDB_G0284213 [Corticium candelabrum]|uniref:putative uncharacterized protein DDB_G0284213 n=1 Tax=Corticium candelabrum TaxID=121492 RepID=UPI002E27020A|nr:putative uncharacterized protein DDB_G0284213 [Corticium candelabrum]